MRMKRSLGLGFLTLLFSLIPFQGVAAQEPAPSDDEINIIARQLYCPVCENIPLDVCPTQACEQWRGMIKEKLILGWDEDQIKQYFVDQYGDRVLATPPARGLNWLVYVLPPLAILVGAIVLFNVFRTWSAAPDDIDSSAEIPEELRDDPYAALLEEELRKREGSEGMS